MDHKLGIPALIAASLILALATSSNGMTTKLARYQIAAFYAKENSVFSKQKSIHSNIPYLKVKRIWIANNMIYASLDEQKIISRFFVAIQHTSRLDIWAWTGKTWQLKSTQRGASAVIVH